MVAVVFNTGDESYFDSSYGFLFRRQSTKTMTVTDSGGRTETYGTFTVGETVNVENKDMHDNVVTTFSAKFEGTFVRSGTEPIADRTYLVVSYVDASYGTRYVLIGPHTTDTLESEFDMASDITVENYFIPCFLPGTLVATPTGERKIEELVAGDLVLARGGGGITPYP